MNKHALEVFHIGGDSLMNVVTKEFTKSFFIVARTPEYIILSDGLKNVSFCRLKNKVLGRNFLDKEIKLSRK